MQHSKQASYSSAHAHRVRSGRFQRRVRQTMYQRTNLRNRVRQRSTTQSAWTVCRLRREPVAGRFVSHNPIRIFNCGNARTHPFGEVARLHHGKRPHRGQADDIRLAAAKASSASFASALCRKHLAADPAEREQVREHFPASSSAVGFHRHDQHAQGKSSACVGRQARRKPPCPAWWPHFRRGIRRRVGNQLGGGRSRNSPTSVGWSGG